MPIISKTEASNSVINLETLNMTAGAEAATNLDYRNISFDSTVSSTPIAIEDGEGISNVTVN